MTDAASWRCGDAEPVVHKSIGLASSHPARFTGSQSESRLLLAADVRLDNRDELARLLGAELDRLAGERTDARLILAAYLKWGTQCASYLLGDFAFALYDTERHSLFAARDAMGMRPLYYMAESKRMLFASEIKQVLAACGNPPSIFEPAILAHLRGHFANLEWTCYSGILQLLPGHVLVAGPNGTQVTRYWEIDPQRRIVHSTRDDYAQDFLDRFRTAVRARMPPDSTPGVLLSGGMDSGSVASVAGALAARGEAKRIRAYCWAFDRVPECDERSVSNRLVSHYDLPVTHVPTDESWPLAEYPLFGPDRDEPFVGVYQAIIERALQTARDDSVDVMLGGDRGDLMVGSWVLNYLPLLRWNRLTELWAEVRSHRRWTDESLPVVLASQVVSPAATALARRIRRPRRKAPASSDPPWIRVDAVRRWAGAFDEPDSLNPYTHDYGRQKRYEAVFEPLHMRGVVWSNRTYARYGIQFADPWSDRRIAEFVLAAPQHVISPPGAENKMILREAMRDIMPEEVLARARKVSPYPFYRRALEEWSVDTVNDLLENSHAASRGYIDATELARHYEGIRRGEREHPCFWWALAVEMWLRQWGT